MTKAEQIRDVIIQLIDIQGKVYDMTHMGFNTNKELREALRKLEEAEQELKQASYIEDDNE